MQVGREGELGMVRLKEALLLTAQEAAKSI